MMRFVVGLLMLFAIAPVCGAYDLTDAMLSVDPRNRLETGRGAALSSVYGPKEDEETPAPETEAELDQTPPGVSYGSYYGGLRSAVAQPDAAPHDDTSLATPRLSLPEGETPLGRPDQRDGVWYGDESAR